MKKVSDYLYFKKVPQTKDGTFPKEALDLIEDTEIQRIIKDTYSNIDLSETLD
jgi:hypothetical protein